MIINIFPVGLVITLADSPLNSACVTKARNYNVSRRYDPGERNRFSGHIRRNPFIFTAAEDNDWWWRWRWCCRCRLCETFIKSIDSSFFFFFLFKFNFKRNFWACFNKIWGFLKKWIVGNKTWWGKILVSKEGWKKIELKINSLFLWNEWKKTSLLNIFFDLEAFWPINYAKKGSKAAMEKMRKWGEIFRRCYGLMTYVDSQGDQSIFRNF